MVNAVLMEMVVLIWTIKLLIAPYHLGKSWDFISICLEIYNITVSYQLTFALFVCCRKFSSISSQLPFQVSDGAKTDTKRSTIRPEVTQVSELKWESRMSNSTLLVCFCLHNVKMFFLSLIFFNKNKCLVFLQVNTNLLALHL